MTNESRLTSPALAAEINRTWQIAESFLKFQYFFRACMVRKDTSKEVHLFAYLMDEYLESTLSFLSLVQDGIHGPIKRELRFLLESSIKICYVQQKAYMLSIEDKMAQFEDSLSSHKISMKKDLNLHYFSKDLSSGFQDDVGRAYGELCEFVHLSNEQINLRLTRIRNKEFPGKESAETLSRLNLLIEKNLSLCIALLFHSVPQFHVGDFLVNSDGTSFDWYFSKSKYINAVDEYFDYKAERADILESVKAERAKNTSF